MLADVRLPESDGLDLLRRIRTQAPDVDIVMIPAFDDVPTVAAGMKQGAASLLTKPLDLPELRRGLGRSPHQNRRGAQAPRRRRGR